jgi:Lipocalin-like domain
MSDDAETVGIQPKTTVQESQRDKILGSWQMVSWTIKDLSTGQISPALGDNPVGYITYTPEGRVMVLVLRGDRRKPAALVPTDAEKVALYDSMFAYAGTYSVDDEKVLHHIDMSWNEAWTGTTQVRFLRLQGDMLTYTSSPAPNPLNGHDCVHNVIFRRAR